MKTVAERWAMFEALVLPRNVGSVQRQEMRRAFYSGFQEALTAGIEMADESGADDELGVRLIQSLHEECQRFGKAIQAGKA